MFHPTFRRFRGWRALAALIVASASAASHACGPHPVGVSPYGRLLQVDAQGQATGLDVELIALLAQRSGCDLPLQVNSRAGVAKGMANGSIALSPSSIASPERAALGELWPYARSPLVVLLPRALASTITDREAFLQRPELRLVAVRSHRHGDDLEGWVSQLRQADRVSEASDVPAALRALRAGRAHALISVAVAIDASMDDFVPVDWDRSGGVVGHLWVNHQVPAADRRRLQAALNALLADGSIERLHQRHLGETWGRRASLRRGT